MRWQSLLCVMLSLLATTIASNSFAKTLNVPEKFKTISEALEQSVPGDEVIVAPGHYNEHIKLKQGVTLRSKATKEEHMNFTAAARTIIQGTGYQEEVVLGESEAILDGFTIKNFSKPSELNSEKYGIKIKSTNTTVTNCVIESLPYTAIKITGSYKEHPAIIENNKIYNNKGNGITCDNKAVATIKDNEVYNNVKSGVENRNGAMPVIIQNDIHDNDIDGIMNTFANPTILNNHIHGNGLNGIGLQKHSVGTVENNTISGNTQAGIGMRSQAQCNISNNKIHGNMIGIGLMDIKQATIESNKIGRNNIGIGLIRCMSGKVFLRNNDLRGNMIIPISPNMSCEVTQQDNIR